MLLCRPQFFGSKASFPSLSSQCSLMGLSSKIDHTTWQWLDYRILTPRKIMDSGILNGIKSVDSCVNFIWTLFLMCMSHKRWKAWGNYSVNAKCCFFSCVSHIKKMEDLGKLFSEIVQWMLNEDSEPIASIPQSVLLYFIILLGNSWYELNIFFWWIKAGPSIIGCTPSSFM